MALYTWANLNSQRQGEIQNFVNSIRSLEIQVYGVILQAQALNSIWNGNASISGLSGMISNLDVIPNTSNLAGAQQLSPADITNNHANYINTLAGFATTNIITEFSAAAGPINLAKPPPG